MTTASPADSLRAWVQKVQWDLGLTDEEVAAILRGEAVNLEARARSRRR